MIEFDGYISGEAKKRFFEKEQNIKQNALLVSLLFFFPAAIIYTIKTEYWLTLWLYILAVGVILLAVRIPKSIKEKEAITPKKIYIEDDVIVCVSNKQTERRFVKDVKEVLDCKTYYELVFKFGKLSANFICQKDLLAQGTLEDFELLFEGKMTDLTSYFE